MTIEGLADEIGMEIGAVMKEFFPRGLKSATGVAAASGRIAIVPDCDYGDVLTSEAAA